MKISFQEETGYKPRKSIIVSILMAIAKKAKKNHIGYSFVKVDVLFILTL
jgi:hypothetical protein